MKMSKLARQACGHEAEPEWMTWAGAFIVVVVIPVLCVFVGVAFGWRGQ